LEAAIDGIASNHEFVSLPAPKLSRWITFGIVDTLCRRSVLS
jgi:hypothetical protein